MPVQIQLRRDTAANWTSANPTLAAGELGLETDTAKYKIGNGSTAWTSLAYSSLPSTALSATIVDAKGDLLVGTANDTVGRLEVGANNTLLVADSAQTNGVKWSATLSGLTLTSPVISSISNTGTVTLPTSTDTLVGRATTDTLTNKTLTSPVVNQGILNGAEERWNVSATASTGTINVNALTSTAWYYTTNASANWTLNFRGDGSTTLSSLLATGDAITIVFAAAQGTTAYRPTTFQIDGSSVTPLWQGGTAPTAGNASSTDVYVFTILKTAATPTYTVFASQTQFK